MLFFTSHLKNGKVTGEKRSAAITLLLNRFVFPFKQTFISNIYTVPVA